jgi:peptidoglycan/LPS O-acetylase OafA/YrhL
MRPVCPHDPAGPSPPRLAFVDGLRGLTAVYVVLHHAALNVPPEALSFPAGVVRFLLRHGHAAVSIFAVLSGFSLMLGAVGRDGGQLPGGTLGYLRRRARRILPPYYAALGLAWLLAAAIPAMGRPEVTPWDRALPACEPGVIASHLLLVHNLDGRWFYRVAPSFWSLATEWQIYLLFPALLAVWRKRGIASVVAAGFVLGSAVALLSLPLGNPALLKLCPWYLGLFALGMAGAAASRESRRVSARLTWTLMLMAVAVTAMAVVLTGDGSVMLADILTGGVVACLLMRRARRAPSSTPPAMLRLIEARWAVALGACSYSLYLIHYPLLALANIVLRDCGMRGDGRLAAQLLVVTPLCVVAAEVFRRAFDRGPSRSRQLTSKRLPDQQVEAARGDFVVAIPVLRARNRPDPQESPRRSRQGLHTSTPTRKQS